MLVAAACLHCAAAEPETEGRPPNGTPVAGMPESESPASPRPGPGKLDLGRPDPINPPVDDTKVEQLKVKVLADYPHDPTAFTQGLVWDGGVLFESTGLYGRSTVRRVDANSGQVLEKTVLDPNFFGEGLARVDDRLIQLTWKAGIALVYELVSLELIDEYGYNGDGWGLAYDGERLVMSNGSEFLTHRDPRDFRWLKTIEVLEEGRPLDRLNELELVDDQLYANVWGENRIVRIYPESGRVTASVDASGLLTAREARMVDVLNGIAYDPSSQSFWLTGKFWPRMFQVEFVPAE